MDKTNSSHAFDAAKENLLARGQTSITLPWWSIAVGALFVSLLSFPIVFWIVVVAAGTLFLLSYSDKKRELDRETEAAKPKPEKPAPSEGPNTQPEPATPTPAPASVPTTESTDHQRWTDEGGTPPPDPTEPPLRWTEEAPGVSHPDGELDIDEANDLMEQRHAEAKQRNNDEAFDYETPTSMDEFFEDADSAHLDVDGIPDTATTSRSENK